MRRARMRSGHHLAYHGAQQFDWQGSLLRHVPSHDRHRRQPHNQHLDLAHTGLLYALPCSISTARRPAQDPHSQDWRVLAIRLAWKAWLHAQAGHATSVYDCVSTPTELLVKLAIICATFWIPLPLRIDQLHYSNLSV